MNRRSAVALAGLLIAAAALLAGCEAAEGGRGHELADAQQELRRLIKANEDMQSVVADQQQQIATLQTLGKKRLEKLFYAERIEFGRYTGGIDLDGKEGHDAIKVYLRPIDQHGSTLKAAGEVTIELYDLAAETKEKLIGKYHWPVDKAASRWSSSFVTYHYSFICRWKSSQPKHNEITVRAIFTDYMTGKTFTAQKLCKIVPPPTTQPK